VTEYVYQMDDSLLVVMERTFSDSYERHGAAVARLQDVVDAINAVRKSAVARTTCALEDLVVSDPGAAYCCVLAMPAKKAVWGINLASGDILAVTPNTGIVIDRGDVRYVPRGNIWQENPLACLSVSGELMPDLQSECQTGKKKTENLSISTCANTRTYSSMSYAIDA